GPGIEVKGGAVPEPVEIRYTLATLNLASFFAARRRGWRWLISLGAGMLWFVLLVVLGGVIGRLGTPDREASGYFSGGLNTGILLMCLSGLVLMVRHNRQMSRAWRDAPLAQGETVMRLDAAGIRIAGPMSISDYKWSSIVRVLPARRGLTLMLGRTVFLPVPSDGLPEGIDRPELMRRIEIWRQTAAGAPPA
ncbi:MAG: YcxB family protein, partial [Pseudomonadota bacterium]